MGHYEFGLTTAEDKSMSDTAALQAYIKRENSWITMFPGDKVTPLVMPETSKQAYEMIERLERDLSPENLTCDGEISGDLLSDRFQRLDDARKQAVTLRCDLEYGKIEPTE